MDTSGVQFVVDVDDFINEIEEVSNMYFIFIFLVVFFEDFLVINVNYAVLHIQLLVIHLIFLANLTQSILQHEEEFLTVQKFLILLIVVAPNHRINIIELLLRQIYSHEILLSDKRRGVGNLIF